MSAVLQRAIIAAVAGDDLGALGRTYGRRHVGPCCGTRGREPLCLSCRIPLANRAQVEMHCERGVHVIAAVCPEHGPEAFRWWAA